MTAGRLRIAAIPGDGVGHDVIPVAVEVVREAAAACGTEVEADFYNYGAVRYLAEGAAVPENVSEVVQQLVASHEAVLFGGAGLDPRVPPEANCRELLRALRYDLDLYVNLRPAPLLDRRFCPLRADVPIDLVVMRENTEGIVAARMGGIFKKGTPDEVAIQEDINTRKGVERICRYAFAYARDHGYPKVTMADKYVALVYAHDLWQRVFREVAEDFPEVEAEHRFIDTLCMELVQHPERFAVIVTNNMYGDILSDLCAGLVGGVGLAASGCIHPGRVSMFEPVHGTAPDIALQGIANPFAAVLTGRILLDTVGEERGGRLIWEAVRLAVREGKLTGDLGGSLGTLEVGEFLCGAVRRLSEEIP